MAQLQVHKVFGALPGTPVDNSLYFVKTLADELRIYVTESSGNIAREIVVGGQVDSIQAGDNITIDNTDPTSPIVSVSGLNAADISDFQAAVSANADVIAALAHVSTTNNPHSVTASQVGLGNVDNTSDLDKPISTATQTALDGKANTTHTHVKADITDFNDADYATAAQGATADSAVQPGDIDTLAELNSIITDATLIDTSDPRLSDTRDPNAHTHTASEITDFDTEVSNNPDVVANSAKDGITSQQASDIVANNAKVSIPAGGTADQVLSKVDGTDYNVQWSTPSGGGGGATVLADLTDVDGATPADFDVLTWNDVQSYWEPFAVVSASGSINTHIDVDTSGGVSNGQILIYNGSSLNFEPGDIPKPNALEIEVFQPTHGLTLGTVVKPSTVINGWYEEAQADSVANAEVVGIISEVIDASNYKVQLAGNLTAGVPAGSHGDVVFLSPTVAGGTTTTKPTTNGQVIKPIGVLVGNPLTLRMFDYIGTLIDDGISPPVSKDKSFTIESPTASEDIGLWRTNVDITITGIHAVSLGTTPSVTYTIRFDSDRSATGTEVVTGGSTTTSTTTGDTVSSFDDATIPAGSWIWLETTAQSGTTDQISITINYDE